METDWAAAGLEEDAFDWVLTFGGTANRDRTRVNDNRFEDTLTRRS